MGDNERMYAMKLHLWLEGFLLPVGSKMGLLDLQATELQGFLLSKDTFLQI